MSDRSIFLAALECADESKRQAYLDEACQGDAALRQRVEALLAAEGRLGNFLAQPHTQVDATQAPVSERPGAQIGPYKLMELIGEGGFGLVFVAEQHDPVRRKVALKVIKPGMDTREVIARFEAERQALAIMDHPNIAKVFGGGTTPSGRPYFVMELVKGVPITDYCDQNHLTPRERLELFIPVCQAVQHAHQKGIIHRDLKPTNVLVSRHDTTPVVKVIDFGVAKALGQELTDKTLFTRINQMVGTPLYMSPEQAGMSDLDVDTRSDIYSLGVLLYELLTGTTPFTKERFKQAAYDEIRRIIRDEEPPKPSTKLSGTETLPSIAANRNVEPAKLQKLVRGELDWIVMKCLEKDRNRRYETANGLARDLERYLHDEPVQACPPSATYRLRKFARRNRPALFMGGIIAATLIVATAISSWQALRATRSQAEAQQNLNKAREAVKKMLTRVAEEEIQYVPQMEPVRKALLADALEFYDDFLRLNPDDPSFRAEAGLAHVRFGEILRQLNEIEQARKSYDQGIELLEQVAADRTSEPEYIAALGNSYEQLGWIGKMSFADQEVQFSKAASIFERLTKERPQEPEYRFKLLRCYNDLFWLNVQMTEIEDSKHYCSEGQKVGRQLVQEHPDSATYKGELGRNQFFLALALNKAEPGPSAERQFREAIQTLGEVERKKTPIGLGYRQCLAAANDFLGQSLVAQGRQKEALEPHRERLRVWQNLASEYPQSFTYQNSVAQARAALVDLLVALGKKDEADALSRQSAESYEKRVEQDPADFQAWLSLVPLYISLREYDKAAAASEKLIAAVDELDVRQVLQLTGKWQRLVSTLSKDRLAEADAWCQRIANLCQQLPADYPKRCEFSVELGHALRHYAYGLWSKSRLAEAQKAFEEAAELFDELRADEPPQAADYLIYAADSYRQVGRVCGQQDQVEKAERAFRKAIELHRQRAKAFPQATINGSDFLATYANLSQLLLAGGRGQEVLSVWQEMLCFVAWSQPGAIDYRACEQLAELRHQLAMAGIDADPAAVLDPGIAERRAQLAKESTAAQIRTDLRRGYRAKGLIYEHSKRFTDAIDAFENVLQVAAPPPESPHELVTAERELIFGALLGRSICLDALGREKDAEASWKEMYQFANAPPDNWFIMRTVKLFHNGQPERAVRLTGETFLKQPVGDGGPLYNAACMYALASAHAKLSDRKEELSRRAVELLTEAKAAGYFADANRLEHATSDKDLDPLRGRDDFQRLFAKKPAEPDPLPQVEPSGDSPTPPG